VIGHARGRNLAQERIAEAVGEMSTDPRNECDLLVGEIRLVFATDKGDAASACI
jgi:hypothetical protein